MRILIALPAYNEAKVIGKVLQSLPKKIDHHQVKILVVDDGSTDKTPEIAGKKADIVLKHAWNQGFGCAITTAFAYARRNKFDILVTFDADGQHRAEDIVKLVLPLINRHADVVIGSRLLGKGKMPLSRRYINYFANLLLWISSGIRSSDSQSGLRAFGERAIQKIRLKTRGMEVSSEILTQVKQHGLKYKEISIPAIYTAYSKSKGQQLSNAPNVFIKLIFRIIR